MDKNKEKTEWPLEIQSRRPLRSKLSRISLLISIVLFIACGVLIGVMPWCALHVILICAFPVFFIFSIVCDYVMPRKITKLTEKDVEMVDLSMVSNIYGSAAFPNLGMDAMQAIRASGEPIENGEEVAIEEYEKDLRKTQLKEEQRRQKYETDYTETKALFSEFFPGCRLKKEKKKTEQYCFVLQYDIDEFRAKVKLEYKDGQTFGIQVTETKVGGITIRYPMEEHISYDNVAEINNIREALRKLKEFWE